jgi:hypothetical protein
MNPRKIILLMAVFGALNSYAAEPVLITSGGTGVVSAAVNIYSGRSAPTWNLSVDEMSSLKERLKGLPSAGEVKTPVWGYIHIKNSDPKSGLGFDQLYIFKRTIVSVDSSGEKTYYKDANDVWGFLVSRGDANDPYFVPPKRLTLPEGTPAIAVVPSNISVTADRGATHKSFFTVFNEGKGVLAVQITSPSFVVLESSSFSVPPGKGIDVPLAFDTSAEGVYEAIIEIKSNDPAKSSLNIPVMISLSSQTNTNDQGALREDVKGGEPGKVIDDASNVNENEVLQDARGSAGVNIYPIVLVFIAAGMIFIAYGRLRR